MSQIPPHDIDAPKSEVLIAVYAYWSSKRRDRAMPARGDIDPLEIKAYLPNIVMYEPTLDDDYRIRLVGTSIVDFLGMDTTGKTLRGTMPLAAAVGLRDILNSVAQTGLPRFRTGSAYWWRKKEHRTYEAAFLPLSPDNRSVTIIFGGIVFDTRLGH